jgi:hypothetical protein
MRPGAFKEAKQEQEPASGTPQGVQVLSFLCGLLVAYLGFKSGWQDYSRIHRLRHLDDYVGTPGKFLQVKVRRDTTSAAEDYYPDVLYEYSVDGKSVWGWRLSYEEEPMPKTYWESRLSGYAAGAPVEVYYNPGLPKDSILEKKHDGLYRVWTKLALGIGFLLAGLVLAVLPLAGWLRGISVRK